MRRSQWLRLLALLAAFGIFAAACSDDSDSDSASTTTAGDDGGSSAEPGASVDGTLKFGSIMPLTGDLADFGPGMQAAVELAVEDMNAAGGVLGADVGLVSEDSGTDPDIANTAAERLLGAESVDGILGAAGSTVTLSGVIAPTVAAQRVECTGSATGPQFTTYEDDGLFFRTAPSDTFQGQLIGDTIAADGHTTVVIVNRADDYGEALAVATSEALDGAGIDVLAEIPIDPDGTDFAADVELVGAEAADAVVVVAFPPEGAALLTEMITQGAGPSDIPIYGTDGLASEDLPGAVDPDDPSVLDGMKGTRPGSTEEPTEFNARLTDEKGIDEVTFAAQFYDCAVVLGLAAEMAGTDDPVEIAKNVVATTEESGTECTSFADCSALIADGEAIKYVGVTQFVFNDTGEPSEGVYEVWDFVDGLINTLATETVSAGA